MRDVPAGVGPLFPSCERGSSSAGTSYARNKTWTEQHEAIASRVVLTDRAQQAGEEVGHHDRADSSFGAQLAWGVARDQTPSQLHSEEPPLVVLGHRRHALEDSLPRNNGLPAIRAPACRCIGDVIR